MFDVEVVVVVGSQSILVGWPNAPDGLRGSDEIDVYPANAAKWEDALNSALKAGEPPYEASEHINALCGEGSGVC